MSTYGDALNPIWTAVAAVAGLLSGPGLSKIAHRRSLHQPMPAHPDIESRLVDSVLTRPGLYVYIHQLQADHFVDLVQAKRWERIREELDGIELPDVTGSSDKAYAELAACETLVPADLATRTGLTPSGGEVLSTPADLVAKASLVYSSGLDREEFAGRSRIERTGDPGTPLVRRLERPGRRRHLFAGVLTAFGAATAVLTAQEAAGPGAPRWFALLALLALTAGSVVWTLVDLDTMYIDTPSFLIGATAAWAFALLAVVADGRADTAVYGLVGAGGIVVFIEVVNQLYKRIRGQHGMGMGDYMLIVATIGVPVAVVGDWQLTQVILIVSLLAGIAGWVKRRLLETGFDRSTPYAFGPYLATGWMITLALWAVTR